jgi:Xaa-Pro dipeptidase
VRDGEVVLMDCGCAVQGYQSDISRTFVFGEPMPSSARSGTDARGQAHRHRNRARGRARGCGRRRRCARNTRNGVRARYKLPGTSHRTGHGIGLDGHEPVNLVHGRNHAASRLACVSATNPGLSTRQVRHPLEDCFHMGEKEPVWFSKPPDSLDKPFG